MKLNFLSWTFRLPLKDWPKEKRSFRFFAFNAMLPAPLISDSEASAIWVYLNTIPLIHNPKDANR